MLLRRPDARQHTEGPPSFIASNLPASAHSVLLGFDGSWVRRNYKRRERTQYINQDGCGIVISGVFVNSLVGYIVLNANIRCWAHRRTPMAMAEHLRLCFILQHYGSNNLTGDTPLKLTIKLAFP
ncbi:hypothetical protein NC652_019967 [Populus alba x Populus x berolinensis]|nr:hypothetical protein NC652_019967 [Populus alba x Populus x berolinensis]